MEDIDVMKRGDNYLRFGLRRGYHKPLPEGMDPSQADQLGDVGITISLKSLRELEEFMRSLGSGERMPVEMFGKDWVALPGEKPLEVWDLGKVINMGNMAFDLVGQPLDAKERGTGRPLLNLSFLRLVGISEGDGVRFGLRMPYPKEELVNLRAALAQSAKKFCDEYLCPIDLSFAISSF